MQLYGGEKFKCIVAGDKFKFMEINAEGDVLIESVKTKDVYVITIGLLTNKEVFRRIRR